MSKLPKDQDTKNIEGSECQQVSKDQNVKISKDQNVKKYRRIRILKYHRRIRMSKLPKDQDTKNIEGSECQHVRR